MKRMISEHLGGQIRNARRAAGLTQRELGLAVGEQHQTIQKIESGSVRIKADQIWSIAKALGRPVEWFFAGLDEVASSRPEPRGPSRRAPRKAPPPAKDAALRRVGQKALS